MLKRHPLQLKEYKVPIENMWKFANRKILFEFIVEFPTVILQLNWKVNYDNPLHAFIIAKVDIIINILSPII